MRVTAKKSALPSAWLYARFLNLDPSSSGRLVTVSSQFRYDSLQVPAAGCLEQIHATTFDVVHVKDWRADEALEHLLPFD